MTKENNRFDENINSIEEVIKQDKKGKIICITGQYGIGKSTLVQKFQEKTNKKTKIIDIDLDDDELARSIHKLGFSKKIQKGRIKLVKSLRSVQSKLFYIWTFIMTFLLTILGIVLGNNSGHVMSYVIYALMATTTSVVFLISIFISLYFNAEFSKVIIIENIDRAAWNNFITILKIAKDIISVKNITYIFTFSHENVFSKFRIKNGNELNNIEVKEEYEKYITHEINLDSSVNIFSKQVYLEIGQEVFPKEKYKDNKIVNDFLESNYFKKFNELNFRVIKKALADIEKYIELVEYANISMGIVFQLEVLKYKNPILFSYLHKNIDDLYEKYEEHEKHKRYKITSSAPDKKVALTKVLKIPNEHRKHIDEIHNILHLKQVEKENDFRLSYYFLSSSHEKNIEKIKKLKENEIFSKSYPDHLIFLKLHHENAVNFDNINGGEVVRLFQFILNNEDKVNVDLIKSLKNINYQNVKLVEFRMIFDCIQKFLFDHVPLSLFNEERRRIKDVAYSSDNPEIAIYTLLDLLKDEKACKYINRRKNQEIYNTILNVSKVIMNSFIKKIKGINSISLDDFVLYSSIEFTFYAAKVYAPKIKTVDFVEYHRDKNNRFVVRSGALCFFEKQDIEELNRLGIRLEVTTDFPKKTIEIGLNNFFKIKREDSWEYDTVETNKVISKFKEIKKIKEIEMKDQVRWEY